MDLRQNNYYFSKAARTLCLAVVACTLSACSIYQSSARQAIQKNSGNIVTGFYLQLNTKYECIRANHTPDLWHIDSTPLDEYVESEGIQAKLLQTDDLPVVLVSVKNPIAIEFEGCTLQILDSKLSSQRLQDVVTFGEKLLTTSTSNQ